MDGTAMKKTRSATMSSMIVKPLSVRPSRGDLGLVPV
jgi:hypothetical protein